MNTYQAASRDPVRPDPAAAAQVSAQRARAVRALANRADVRKRWRKREPDLARAIETELAAILEGASS